MRSLPTSFLPPHRALRYPAPLFHGHLASTGSCLFVCMYVCMYVFRAGFSLVAVSGGYSSLRYAGFSLYVCMYVFISRGVFSGCGKRRLLFVVVCGLLIVCMYVCMYLFRVGFSPVAVSGGYSSLRYAGFSLYVSMYVFISQGLFSGCGERRLPFVPAHGLLIVCMYLFRAGFSLVAASWGYSSLQCAGFSLWWLLLSRSTGSRHAGFSSCGTWAQ